MAVEKQSGFVTALSKRRRFLVGVGTGRPPALRWLVALLCTLGLMCLPALMIRANGWDPWGYSSNSALVDPVYIDLTARLGNLMDLHQLGDIYASFQFEAFTYPPPAIFLFFPLQWLSFWGAIGAWTLLSLCSLTVCSWVVVRNSQLRFDALSALSALSAWSLTCVVSVSGSIFLPAIYQCFSLGQTGLLLLAMVTVDYWIQRNRLRGVLTGLATAFKIYPIIFILWWLIRREFKEALVAVSTCGLAILGSFLCWPKSFHTYISAIVLGGAEISHLDGGLKRFANSSLISPLLKTPLVDHPIPDWLQILILLVGISVGLWVATRIRSERPLTTFLLVCMVSVSCSFVTWDHYLVFMVFLPLTFYENRERWLRVVLGLLTLASVTPFWKMRYVGGHSWTAPTERFLGSEGMWAISFLFVTTCLLLAVRQPRSEK